MVTIMNEFDVEQWAVQLCYYHKKLIYLTSNQVYYITIKYINVKLHKNTSKHFNARFYKNKTKVI